MIARAIATLATLIAAGLFSAAAWTAPQGLNDALTVQAFIVILTTMAVGVIWKFE